MNIVDTSGWLENFADSTQPKHFAAAIEDIQQLETNPGAKKA